MRKSLFRRICLILLTITSASCQNLQEELEKHLEMVRPTIVSVSPENNAQNVGSDTTVVITFSSEMDTVKTNNSFTLSSSAGVVKGYFAWSDGNTKMTFTPQNALVDSGQYMISLTTEAEDTTGNDLAGSHTSVFFVNYDINPPRVTGHTPLNGALGVPATPPGAPLPAGAAIQIDFSEPIDIDTIYDGISISPSVDGSWGWSAGQTSVYFYPMYDLSYGTTYTVSINQSLTDAGGTPLDTPYFFNFTVGNDFEDPQIASVTQGAVTFTAGAVTPGVEKQATIVITFNENINETTLYDAISLSPSCNHYITYDPAAFQATIHFVEAMESETNYLLSIAGTIRDLQGNSLGSAANYYFLTNGPNSIRPTVTGIADPIVGAWSGVPVDLLMPIGTVYPDNPQGIRVTFSTNMNPATITTKIEKVYGTGLMAYIINPSWPTAFSVFEFYIENIAPGNTYTVTIKGGSVGARDANGNYMLNDHVTYIRF
ncbi:MAG TPA: Ig-like domain-containing protein [Spirochaetota bacterium]|nr:Ig-like domain-containing protein [Spirochaetota bacterium]